MSCLTPKDLSAVLAGAVPSLTPSDIRGFIYRCITNREIAKGLMMADQAIAFALGRDQIDRREASLELVGAVAGTLTVLAEDLPPVKAKIDELLHHERSEIAVAVIENLGYSSSLDNFNRIGDLLLHQNPDVALAAAKYVEACTRDAAFRNRRELHVIEDQSEEFLRRALLTLERIYQRLKEQPSDTGDIRKRIAILVAMMYSEILDSMDWRRLKAEQFDERIYYALQEHLTNEVGPEAHPYLRRMLSLPDVEIGIKRSALHTLGRLCGKEAMRTQIAKWLPSYITEELSIELTKIAKSILKSSSQGKPFSPLSLFPEDTGQNIVPRTAGAPPRLKKKIHRF